MKDEICLVTGASRGIGREIARALGQAGATVVGTATSPEGAKSISSYLADGGAKGVGLVLQLGDEQSITALPERVAELFGAPTILINNAGITRDNLMLRMKNTEWDEVINTNLTAAFKLTRICLKAMTRSRKGRIVNITSVVGVTGNPGQANYAAAKAGIIGFTKSLAAEVASRNITVNAVAPGFIQTDMTGALNDTQKETLMKRIPMNRLGTPEDIAQAVLFLASDAASYITGATLHVNGGMYMS